MNGMISFGGRGVVGFGHPGALGDVGDLLAYRQMWEPFIAAHLELWRDLNSWFESNSAAQKCPPGIFTAEQIQKTNLDATSIDFCVSLVKTRMYVSDTHPSGILTQWNAWKDTPSAKIVAGASEMLTSQQNVVMRVGGIYKDDLVSISKRWGLNVELPNTPSFSLQQEVLARIEGAYITTKGILGIIGYGANETLTMASDVAQATAQGLKDTAKALPTTTRWIGIAAAVTAVIVGGVLVIYYVPKRTEPKPV